MSVEGQMARTDLRRLDRAFYLSMSALTAGFVLVGFARSFFFSRWFSPPPGTPHIGPLLLTHGLVFSTWVFLAVVQPTLIATDNVSLHRRMGIFGACVVALMYGLGNIASIAAMHVGFIGLGDPYVFYAIPFFDIQIFALFIALAVIRRNHPEEHKRLILLASTQILEAAMARLPIAAFQAAMPYASLFANTFVIVAGMTYDLATRRRIHPVWIWGGAIVVASEAGRLLIQNTQAWISFAHFMASLYVPR